MYDSINYIKCIVKVSVFNITNFRIDSLLTAEYHQDSVVYMAFNIRILIRIGQYINLYSNLNLNKYFVAMIAKK